MFVGILTIKSRKCNFIVKLLIKSLRVQQSIQLIKSHLSGHFNMSHHCSETKASLTVCRQLLGRAHMLDYLLHYQSQFFCGPNEILRDIDSKVQALLSGQLDIRRPWSEAWASSYIRQMVGVEG
jgi:hypothetical protein